MDDEHAPVDFWTALMRGWHGRCPRCNQGRLFSSYLKMKGHCEVCDLALEPYRADDAPAYFVILIVGHIVVPLALLVETEITPAYWIHVALWLPLTLGLSLALLQPIKGVIVGWQWAQQMHGFHPDGVDHSDPRVTGA